MALRDIPILGRLIGVIGVGVDLLFHGGETILALVGAVMQIVLTSPESIVSVVMTLNRLENYAGWLPEDLVNNLMTAVLVIALAVSVVRILEKAAESN